MKTVDILTPNNVTIQYELASVLQRFLALLIDFIIIFIYYLIIYWITFSIFYNSYGGPEITNIILLFLLLPVLTFYNLFCEIFFNGQTIGKKTMQIRVIKATGSPPSLGDYVIRWVYRLIDILFSVGAIAAIFVSSSEKSQRLGDLAANTVIIKLNPDKKYSIKDILKIDEKINREITYPQVIQLTDSDMLFIKNTLDRVKNYGNNTNKQLVLDLIHKISISLNIEEIPKNKIQFLRTLLRDYIVLTR